jgi:hypothetical protein
MRICAYITRIYAYVKCPSPSKRDRSECCHEWISTLDKLEALNPKAVVAGHKVPRNDDDPRIIGETRQYLRDFNRLNAATSTARELYDAMLQIYPDRVNPGSLWGAANIAKKQAPSKNGLRESVSPR